MGNKKSKNKMKRQAQQTNPRFEYVIGQSAEKASSITIQFSPGGEINILEIDPSTLQKQVAYKRIHKSTDKVLYSAPAKSFSLSEDYLSDLKVQFDYLLSVDTNTLNHMHRGHRISICSIYCIPDQLQSLSEKISIIPVAGYIIADRDPGVVAEPIGWHLAVTRHTARPLNASKRVGLVVDHDRNSHIDINARRKPYFRDKYLPYGLSLIYASDKSTETIANEMLRYCDKSADRVKPFVLNNTIEEYLDHPIRVGTTFCYPIRFDSKR